MHHNNRCCFYCLPSDPNEQEVEDISSSWTCAHGTIERILQAYLATNTRGVFFLEKLSLPCPFFIRNMHGASHNYYASERLNTKDISALRRMAMHRCTCKLRKDHFNDLAMLSEANRARLLAPMKKRISQRLQDRPLTP